MTLKLKCEDCGYSYEVSEAEMLTCGEYHVKCLMCNGIIKVENLDEVVHLDMKKRVRDYVSKYFQTLGIEYTLEMLERNKDQACYRLYKAELKRRGFNVI